MRKLKNATRGFRNPFTPSPKKPSKDARKPKFDQLSNHDKMVLRKRVREQKKAGLTLPQI